MQSEGVPGWYRTFPGPIGRSVDPRLARYTAPVNTGVGNRARFPNTHWSLVLAAGSARSVDADTALALLCETYWYPLYAFLRARGHAVEEAQDLTQAFFVQILEKRPFTHANPARGRFRSFLLTSLKNFAVNEYEWKHAGKRGGILPTLSLEVETAEGRFQREPATVETPETMFDRKWAMTLLERALSRLREEGLPGKPEHFDHLKGYLTGDDSGPTYAETATVLGMSEGAVKVAVHRLRRRFRDVVRNEIAHTVSSPEQIDEEIRHLWSAVKRPPA